MNNPNNKLFCINQQVFYIKDNKVKKGIITKISNDDIYVSRFKYCCFKTLIFPWHNCFLTKELAKYTLHTQQSQYNFNCTPR